MKDKDKKCICGSEYGSLSGCEKIKAKCGEAVTKPLLDLKLPAASGCGAKSLSGKEINKLIKENKRNN